MRGHGNPGQGGRRRRYSTQRPRHGRRGRSDGGWRRTYDPSLSGRDVDSQTVYDSDYGPADFAKPRGAPEEAYWPYGRDFFFYGAPVPGEGIYPEHHWGGGVVYGLEGAGYAPFGLIHFPAYGYDYEYPRRRGRWRRRRARPAPARDRGRNRRRRR